MLSTPCVTVPGLRPLSNFFWIPLNFRVKFWIWFYILHFIYIVYGKPCVVVQRPHSLLEFPKLPAQLLTFYHSCFAPTQGISCEKRAWCDLKDSLVEESGAWRKMNDIELAGGKKNCAQLRVTLVYHQAHHTGGGYWRFNQEKENSLQI